MGDKPGKHAADRDGQGKPQPEKWSNATSRDNGNKHGKDEPGGKKK